MTKSYSRKGLSVAGYKCEPESGGIAVGAPNSKKGDLNMYGYEITSEEVAEILMGLTEEELEELTSDDWAE